MSILHNFKKYYAHMKGSITFVVISVLSLLPGLTPKHQDAPKALPQDYLPKISLIIPGRQEYPLSISVPEQSIELISRARPSPKQQPEIPDFSDNSIMIHSSVVSDSSDSTFAILDIPEYALKYTLLNPTKKIDRNGNSLYTNIREINFPDTSSLINENSRKDT